MKSIFLGSIVISSPFSQFIVSCSHVLFSNNSCIMLKSYRTNWISEACHQVKNNRVEGCEAWRNFRGDLFWSSLSCSTLSVKDSKSFGHHLMSEIGDFMKRCHCPISLVLLVSGLLSVAHSPLRWKLKFDNHRMNTRTNKFLLTGGTNSSMEQHAKLQYSSENASSKCLEHWSSRMLSLTTQENICALWIIRLEVKVLRQVGWNESNIAWPQFLILNFIFSSHCHCTIVCIHRTYCSDHRFRSTRHIHVPFLWKSYQNHAMDEGW